MQTKKATSTNGVTLAMLAACLFAGGCQTTPAAGGMATASAATTDLVHCYGKNVCAGHNDCKTAKNDCAGHGSCKGMGFLAVPSKACKDIGGEVMAQDQWMGHVAKADLKHCYGVNACAGHNDCKTANNACAGHGSCKGQGFVAMPEQQCGEAGGTLGA
jgi:hypothetical protein